MWTPQQEKAAEKLLAKLRAEPLAKEREEFGKMLMRHIDSFTPEERKRYEELKAILHSRKEIKQSEQFYCELTNENECRQTGLQCPECKKIEETWK